MAKGHMGTILIFTTRAFRGGHHKYLCRTVPLLVGINLSGNSHMPREKKTPPLRALPLFFRNLFFMLLYLHASEGVGVRPMRTRTPLRYSLCPQIRATRASSRCMVDLDLCRPALTERYHTPHPSLLFRLVTLGSSSFI